MNRGLPRHPSEAPGQPRPPGEEVSYAHPHHKATDLFNAHPLDALSLLGQLGVTAFPEPGVREESLLGCDADSLLKMPLSLGVCGYI